MNHKLTTAIFGKFNPYIADGTVWKIEMKYKSSEAYKTIKLEEDKYLIQKWYFLRKFFEAESLGEDILNINEEFRLRQLHQKRREYLETHREHIHRKRGEKIACECGAVVRKYYIVEHRKSNKHKEMIPNI